MSFGDTVFIIFLFSVLAYIIWLEVRISKVERHLQDHCDKISILLIDFLKRNNKKIKVEGINLDEIFK